MIVTRQFESGRHTWASNKLGTFNDNSSSPRMSNLESINNQPDWREQYPHQYGQHTGNSLQAPSLQTGITSHEPSTSQIFAPKSVEHRHSVTRLGQSQESSGHTIERPGSAPVGDGAEQNMDRMRHDSLVSTHSAAHSHSVLQSSGNSRNSSPIMHINNSPMDRDGQYGNEFKEEELDEDMDDDLDENGTQTEAERNASERKKTKRFRLTHQQTRFLLSEFAKQAHPDAAHRERLAREIPGLSARQVQVWFQNRRAKMKRLNNDDRDRHIKMRQMPEHFDNVQALHSPYGAIHSVGQAMVSPMDYGSAYPDQQVMRPLIVDTMRRQEVEDHMSPTGITPSFHHLGFSSNTSVGTPEMLSPISINASQRYYPGQLSSPVADGPRTSNPFLRHNSSEEYPMHSQDRPSARPLQPLQLRETISRTRSESLQSPLRASMSWKGDSLDYASYPADSSSPPLTGRQQSMYQPDGNVSNYTSGGYNTPAPSNYSAPAAPSGSSPHVTSRFRASSSAYPPSLELRQNQYRNISSHPSSAHPTMGSAFPPTPRHSSFTPITSGGFQSAPLHAPSDFQLPRGSNDAGSGHISQPHEGRDRDYHMNQLSAPMAPPSDFSYQSQGQVGQMLSPSRAAAQEQRREHNTYPQTSENGLSSIAEHRRTSEDYMRDGCSPGHDAKMEDRKRGYSISGSYNPS